MKRLAAAEWVRQKISTVRHPRSNGSMKVQKRRGRDALKAAGANRFL